MFSLQTPDAAPKDFLDILLLPLLFAAIVVVLWASQNVKRKEGKKSKLWWSFLIPAALGAWIGFRNVYFLVTDPIYRADVNSGRMTFTHWATFLLPFATIGLLYLWNFLAKKERSF